MTKRNTTNVVDSFNSLREFIDYASVNDAPRSSDTDDTEFTGGTKSLAEAVNMARQGWDAVRPDVDRMLNEIRDSFGERFAKVNRTTIGVAGGAVHMGRFLAGRPDHMLAFRRTPSTRHGKVVRLLVDYGANGKVPASEMQKRGCVLTVLVDALSTLGLSVELWTETTVNVGSNTHTTLIKLHDSREPLDIRFALPSSISIVPLSRTPITALFTTVVNDGFFLLGLITCIDPPLFEYIPYVFDDNIGLARSTTPPSFATMACPHFDIIGSFAFKDPDDAAYNAAPYAGHP